MCGVAIRVNDVKARMYSTDNPCDVFYSECGKERRTRLGVFHHRFPKMMYRAVMCRNKDIGCAETWPHRCIERSLIFLRFASLSTRRFSPTNSRDPMAALLEGASLESNSSSGNALVSGKASEGNRIMNRNDTKHNRPNSESNDSCRIMRSSSVGVSEDKR